MLIVELLQSSEEFEPEGFEDVDQLRGRSDEFDLVITNWGGSERAGYYVPGGSMLAKFVELMDEEGIEKPIIVATGGNPSPEDKSDFPQVRYWWLVAEERPSEKDVLDAIMAAINDSAEQT